MFSNVNLNSPVKRQKALHLPPTGCSPHLCCFALIHVLADTEKHWSVAFWVMYYYHNICYLCSQAHTYWERKNYLFFSRWHMLFNNFSFASEQTSSFGKNQHDGYFFSFCKDLCRGQGHRRKSCVSGKFRQKPRRWQSPVLRQVHAETLHRAKIPKGAGFLFLLSHLVYPKISIKIRQLLLFPASFPLTLRVPLILMAGSSTPICSALPHTKQLRAPSQRMQYSHPETEITTRFVPFISFYKLGSRQ